VSFGQFGVETLPWCHGLGVILSSGFGTLISLLQGQQLAMHLQFSSSAVSESFPIDCDDLKAAKQPMLLARG
jgi:hypothetical protein